MHSQDVLWIDLCREENNKFQRHAIEFGCFNIKELNQLAALAETLAALKPALLCIDTENLSDGTIQTLEHIKHVHPSIPIIILVTESHEAHVLWALRTRIWDYLKKPVKPEELRLRLNILLALAKKPINSARICITPGALCNTAICCEESMGSHKMEGILAYINTCLDEDLSISRVAEWCGMSPARFSGAFKHHHGKTFCRYVNDLRINRARKLLTSTNLPITDIALTIGYNDPSYFTRMFRRETGESPTNYRENTGSVRQAVSGRKNLS